MAEPFIFRSEASLVRFTGYVADSLRSLHRGLQRVSGSSIFFHVHHALFRRHFTTSEFMNDFAAWAGKTMGEERLAERLSVIDPLQFASVAEARERIIQVVGEAVGGAEQVARVGRDRAFFFQEVQSFAFDTGQLARDLPEFARVVRAVQPDVVFHHLIESRLRLFGGENDFSAWLEMDAGRPDIAEAVRQLSPYVHNLRQMGTEIAEAVEGRL